MLNAMGVVSCAFGKSVASQNASWVGYQKKKQGVMVPPASSSFLLV